MQTCSPIRRVAAAAALAVAVLALAAGPAGARSAARYVPGEVVVGYSATPSAALATDIASRAGARVNSSPVPGVQVLRLARGQTVAGAIGRLRHQPGVSYAVPDYIAHESGGWIPDDRGRSGAAQGWQSTQWNFLAGAGVDAPDAWSHLMADGAPGGQGVTVAVLDTGVAYADWSDPKTHQRFTASPDFTGTRFAGGCDLIRGTLTPRGRVTSASRCTDPFALDRQGHGTFVAGVLAEATNNGLGLTGLAYGATIMPVRILDAQGNGDSVTIARGIRYAVTHGARVINLSLEFDTTITAGDIPEVIQAIDFAHRLGAVVVAASGNDSTSQLAYPARYPVVVSVGATTRDRCVADYSNTGPGLDLVAPGGGEDAALPADPNCHPSRSLPGIFQMTFGDPSSPNHFGLPTGWYGTSMAAPHVAAAAALVIASGVLGAHPSPDLVLLRLELTAQPLGTGARPSPVYGYGLLDAGAATAGVSQTARSPHRTTIMPPPARGSLTRGTGAPLQLRQG